MLLGAIHNTLNLFLFYPPKDKPSYIPNGDMKFTLYWYLANFNSIKPKPLYMVFNFIIMKFLFFRKRKTEQTFFHGLLVWYVT